LDWIYGWGLAGINTHYQERPFIACTSGHQFSNTHDATGPCGFHTQIYHVSEVTRGILHLEYSSTLGHMSSQSSDDLNFQILGPLLSTLESALVDLTTKIGADIPQNECSSGCAFNLIIGYCNVAPYNPTQWRLQAYHPHPGNGLGRWLNCDGGARNRVSSYYITSYRFQYHNSSATGVRI